MIFTSWSVLPCSMLLTNGVYQVPYVVCRHPKFFDLFLLTQGLYLLRVPETFIFEKSFDVMILYVTKFSTFRLLLCFCKMDKFLLGLQRRLSMRPYHFEKSESFYNLNYRYSTINRVVRPVVKKGFLICLHTIYLYYIVCVLTLFLHLIQMVLGQ